MSDSKKIFFLSDLHLGMYPEEVSRSREIKVVQWLESIYREASEIYLLGDTFDYWYEYRKVIPKGFTRFLGKIAEITDAGVKVNMFTGNHDVWIFDYLPKEIGVEVFRHPVIREYGGKKFYIAHGDGLGPGQMGFKLLKWLFTSKTAQWLFSRIHPNASISFAHGWSKKSRHAKGVSVDFLGNDKEYLVLHAREKLKEEAFDYFIFGHRHLPLEVELTKDSTLVYLGDWIENFSYAVLDGSTLSLKKLD
ncbi:MAG TPA: UDP-2,3-diacylglucosamine diphosphatase [Bacteroides sp.]|nr:UDP-2,3-diacylglucosamine diphosphatase [Bacteroides sp.]